MPDQMKIQAASKPLMNLRGRIIRVPSGGPIRTILDFSPLHPCGRFMSAKVHRPMDWEATHERHLYWICEADTAVVLFLSQPHRLEMFLQGRTRPLVYYPDLWRKFADGRVEIVETKRSKNEISDDPEYEEKIGFAKQLYAENRGWTFRVLTAADDIDVEPVLSNARSIKRDAFARIRTRDKLLLLEAIEKAGGQISYAAAIDAVAAGGRTGRLGAQAKLHAMVVRRIAHIDIYRLPILDDTPVTAVRDPQYVLPKQSGGDR